MANHLRRQAMVVMQSADAQTLRQKLPLPSKPRGTATEPACLNDLSLDSIVFWCQKGS